jgi:flagellin-specific chaperone FliS
MQLHRLFWASTLSACTVLSASAGDAVTDAMTEAYTPYRSALFRTNSKAQAESEQAMAQALSAWQALSKRYATQPPAPYDRDAAFQTTLTAVASVYQRAQKHIADSQLSEAHETLEAARDLMADLRQRNGVITFSDHMNAYHSEMEHALNDGPKLLSAPQGMLQLMATVGRLEYLATRLRSQAPAPLASDVQFTAAAQAVEQSVVRLRQATLAQDPDQVKDALGKLKGPYSQMFLKFG